MSIVSEEKHSSSPTGDHEKGKPIAGDVHDPDSLILLGYKPELRRNRSLFTLLFQTLAIAAIPYGEGGPLISAIYGGGPLSIFGIDLLPSSRPSSNHSQSAG